MKVNVIPNFKSIYKVLGPINIVSYLLGIRSFARNRYGNYSYCWSSLIITLTYVIGFYVILNLHDNHDLKVFVDHQSDIVYVMKRLYYVGGILAMTCSYFMCHCNYRNEIKVLKALEEIDANLRSQHLGEKIDEKNKFLNKLQILFLVYIYIIHFGILRLSLEEILFGVPEGLLHLVQFVFPPAINAIVKLQFHFYTVSLRTRVEIINANLNQKIESYTPTSKFTTFFKMEKDIDNMMKIHKKITDTSRLLNRVYGFQELFSFAMCFVLLLSDGYIVLYSLTIGGTIDFGFTIFVSLRALIFHLILLLVDLRACMLLCAKVS